MSITGITSRGGFFTQSARYPLTTLFTPPEDCTASSAYQKSYWAGNQRAFQLDSGVSTPSCYPSQYKQLQYRQSVWYSPGVCPYSYEYVATSVQKQVSGPEVTLAICCPPGLHTAPSSPWSCMQPLTSSETELSFSQSGVAGSSSIDVGEAATTAFANPISVAWQQSDLTLFTPASAPVLALEEVGITFPVPSISSGAPQTDSPVSSTPTTNAAGTAADTGSGGLSRAGAAGIGVGATMGVIALTVGLWWFARRYRLTRREPRPTPPYYYSADPKYDNNTQTVHNRHVAERVQSPIRYEADGRPLRAELEGWQPSEIGKGTRSPI